MTLAAQTANNEKSRSIDLAKAKRRVKIIVASAGSSFYWGMRLLPLEKREAIYAVYAFCREVDDIVDNEMALDDKRAALSKWRQEIGRLYEGVPTHLTAQALQPAVARFELPKSEFLLMLEGMEQDSRGGLSAPTEEELSAYCRRVAGSVGRLSVHIFGDLSPAALDLAIVQGEALQRTNILRDLPEDAARGRLYLTRECLREVGIDSTVPKEVLMHPNLPRAYAVFAEQTRLRYGYCRQLLAQCDRQALRPGAVMLEIYGNLLERLARRPPASAARANVPRPVKLWLALRHGLL